MCGYSLEILVDLSNYIQKSRLLLKFGKWLLLI